MHRYHRDHHVRARPEDDLGGGRFEGRRFGRHGLGGDHGPRGRRGRVFDQGDLRLLILQLIAERPSHGYELIKAVEDKLGGAYSPSPGIVYPTLTLLEELGFATVEPQEGGRRLYAVTQAGRDHLSANGEALDTIARRIADVRARGGAPPPVVRALENLKTALRLKLGSGPLTPIQAAAIAAAIDAAALDVEQV